MTLGSIATSQFTFNLSWRCSEPDNLNFSTSSSNCFSFFLISLCLYISKLLLRCSLSHSCINTTFRLRALGRVSRFCYFDVIEIVLLLRFTIWNLWHYAHAPYFLMHCGGLGSFVWSTYCSIIFINLKIHTTIFDTCVIRERLNCLWSHYTPKYERPAITVGFNWTEMNSEDNQ